MKGNKVLWPGSSSRSGTKEPYCLNILSLLVGTILDLRSIPTQHSSTLPCLGYVFCSISWKARAAFRPEVGQLFLKRPVNKYFWLSEPLDLSYNYSTLWHENSWAVDLKNLYLWTLKCECYIIFTCHKILFF